jgi:hypothetical protein
MVSQTFKAAEYELPNVSTGTSTGSSSLSLSSSSSSLSSVNSLKAPGSFQIANENPPQVKTTTTTTTTAAVKQEEQPPTVRKVSQESFEEAPMWAAIVTYMGYLILNIFGFMRDFFRYVGLETKKGAADPNPSDFVPLYSEYECFYTRNLYTRIRDCFNRPICSVPGATITLVDRYSDDYNWTFKRSGKTTEVLNMGSYNYLGFAENSGKCAQDSIQAIREYGVATSATKQELGLFDLDMIRNEN